MLNADSLGVHPEENIMGGGGERGRRHYIFEPYFCGCEDSGRGFATRQRKCRDDNVFFLSGHFLASR